MAGESVARRYARAAFELALENKQPLEGWLADLETIASVVKDPEVHAVLASPKLSFEQKRALVDRAITGLDPLRRNFVYLLIDRNRVELIERVLSEAESGAKGA